MRQNELISSEGGREGRYEVGGEMYIMIYVIALARAKPTKSVPHCLCIVVETIDD